MGMWLIVTFVFAVIVSLMHLKIKNKKLRLDFFALMLWGAFVMILVDHIIGFITEGGNFIEFTTEGLISSGVMLGIAMFMPILVIWLLAVYTPIGNKICID